MKTSAFALAAALLFSAAATSAQSFVSSATQATGTPRTVALGQPAARYSTRHLASGGSVTYFEAEASRNAQHEQFAQLRQAFETSKPTLVLYQWPDGGIDSTETATISRLGEAGYARFLAHQHQVPTQRLDNPIAEYEHLKTSVDAEQLKLYYLLREVQRYRARTGAPKAVALLAMQQFIDHSSYFLPGTEHVIRTMPELEAAYRKHCPAGGKWWDMSANCFIPSASASQIGSALASINHAMGEYRMQQLSRLVAEQVQAGQRVLVVAAPGYLPAAGLGGQVAVK